MAANWSFWCDCARDARKGTGAFANDWQWLFGVPAVTFLGAYLATSRGAEFDHRLAHLRWHYHGAGSICGHVDRCLPDFASTKPPLRSFAMKRIVQTN